MPMNVTRNKNRMKTELDLTVQQATTNRNCPYEACIRQWVELVLQQQPVPADITVRLVDEAECAELNQQYRKRTGPTNVLSFAYTAGENLCGDIVICAAVVEREAAEQHKDLQSHWAHMVIHGTLHLMGYDHTENNEAEEMEALECTLMHSLGYADPYREETNA